MKNNAELQRDVLDELLWDPSINVANVEVAADRGTATLRGSIASYTEKLTAERDARHVLGVVSMLDQLEVRLTLTGEVAQRYQREAADNTVRFLIGVESVNNQIRIAPSLMRVEVKDLIERALVRNVETDANNIHVDADRGKVRLSGESTPGLSVTRRLGQPGPPGVHEVDNDLTVVA